MSYPGTPSLSQETKDRITTTFHQTLDLAREGRRREAVLGCDFILKMDPLYHPARTLQERLQSSDGAVDTSDLDSRPAAPAPPAAEAAPEGSANPSFETMHLDAGEVNRLSGQSPDAAAADALAESMKSLPSIDDEHADLLALDAAPAVPPSLSTGAPFAPPPPPGRSTGAGRIEELLEEGQVAFDAGEFQKAIDAWSRIFLIDIDHQEAAQRIEQARRYKAERERQVDEAMHEATSQREAGRLDQARSGFEKVLELQPTHITAREQLAELDSGAAPGPVTPAAPAPAPSPPPAVSSPPAAEPPPSPQPPAAAAGAAGAVEDLEGDFGRSQHSYGGEVYGGDLDSFAEEEAAPPSAPAPDVDLGKGGAAKPKRSFLMLGLLVLIVAGAAGWFLYGRWGSILPNVEEPAPAVAAVDVVQRATRTRLAGNTAEALDQLRQLTPDDPAYARAQILIEQWSEDAVEEKAPEVSDDGDEAAESRTRREGLLQRARQAYSEREYLPAAKAFRAADDIEPLEGAAADLYEDTKRQLRPIATQIDLFQQREWEMVVPMLWRKLEDAPENRDLSRMLVNAYFNLGVRDLQRGVPNQAEGRFEEVLSLEPDDQMAQRLLHFSQAYAQTSRDILYDIYVKQLRFRR